ncbi:LytS/YhcK type 5TM receptor domain-containing protein [Aneurinibacillus sp. UBA3580]|uniref:LytS/YhcK type 5TM receptor domain-containing protein n=1 Tax=Aneurinibacillus sp. UBA3580 TaxID=1946041 RepID=UPI00257D62C5|nr:LytS/YhcK type 5TM receptor domain-containing protein [Aneurinibacillus sp. UBA3580]
MDGSSGKIGRLMSGAFFYIKLFDMRSIPLIITILYCGYEAGLFALAVLLLYRYYLGGDGFYATLYIYPVVTCFVVFMFSCFQKSDREKRHKIAMWLALLSSSLVIFGSLLSMQEEAKTQMKFLHFSFEYSLIQLVGVMTSYALLKNVEIIWK